VYTLVVIIIVLLALIAIGFLYSIFKTRIQFYITGIDEGFSFGDVTLLWNVSQICELEQPTSLYYSLPALTKCIAQISSISSTPDTDGTYDTYKSDRYQKIMTKLFDYRTKLQNEADDKKGLTSTTTLDKGQKVRIILPGKGVFASEIVANGTQLVITVPKQKEMIIVPAEDWVGKVISVYLWRKGDARYVFDTTVTQSGLYIGKSSLFLKHSNNLIRTQKRKSVRAKCDLSGELFIVKEKTTDYTAVETQNGYRCKIEDISESGAQVRIGGKGAENVLIKLQFNIANKLIIMFGVIRTVEYNEEDNQSLLHFECTHIDAPMRNEILSYVYQILPSDEKEIIEALQQTDQDIEFDEENSGENSDGSDTNSQQLKQQNYESENQQPEMTFGAAPASAFEDNSRNDSSVSELEEIPEL